MAVLDLRVLVAGVVAGTVHQDEHGLMTFAYDEGYLGPPLSLSMPLSNRTYGPDVLRHLDQARQELDAYFAGRLRAFSLALDVRGTPFQLRVWQGLCAIPYGTTWSYAMLARHIGRPGACRAVGNANGKNPLPIIIPCHRVVRTDGELGGYSAGLDIKRFLLALERI